MRPDAATEYWQSVDEWLDSAQFRDMMKDEFPADADEWLDPVSRRNFLSLMGASVALAGAAGCNPSVKPASQKKVLPYVRQPDQLLPGLPLFFATSMPGPGGVSEGLLVKQTEGRPIKVEGNPNHPGSLGGTNVFAQASILGLYDPDRSDAVRKGGVPYGFDKFLDEVKGLLDAQRAKQGEGIRFLTEPTTSPTLTAQVEEFLKRFPKAKWVQYEPAGRDAAKRAHVAAFGKPVNPVYNLAKAKVVLSLDDDFLSAAGPGNVRHARDFVANRKVRTVQAAIDKKEGVPVGAMNRLYVVESMLTSTGGFADHRLPLKPSKVEDFARALAAQLGIGGVTVPALSEAAGAWLKPLADDLVAHKGAALVLAGDTQPAAVHLIAHAINEKLGAFGQTVTFTDPLEPRSVDNLAEMVTLAKDIAANKVDLLFLLNVNPAYDAPADLDFRGRLAAMTGAKIHLGLYRDETAGEGGATWHVNAAHYLETWGDGRAYDGTIAIQQPLIAPVHGGKSSIDLFAVLLDQGINDPLELVKATWRKYFDEKVKKGDFQAWWETILRDGVVPGTALPPVTVTAVSLEKLNDPAFVTPPPKGGTEVQFRPDLTLWDGRYANNGWLQELPKPVTNLTWDNAAIMSPATAERYGVSTGFDMAGGERGHMVCDLVGVTLGDRTLPEIPVFILPGHADDAVTLHLGFGRERAGKVGTSKGFDTYSLRTTSGHWTLGGAEVKPVGRTYPLACTQGQYLMESRRPARHATVAQFQADKEFAQIPPSSAAEYKELRALTPGTPEDFERLNAAHPEYKREHPYAPHDSHAGHDHGHEGHDHGHEGHDDHHAAAAHGNTAAAHDARIIPLTLYPKNPNPVMGIEANVSYRRWGMAIDLGACTGCMTCTVACVSEVNTPVVGKDQVMRGRAMHWLRIDRYFSIPGDEVMSDEFGSSKLGAAERHEQSKLAGRIKTHFQPVMCQHCEKAPCEVVCPVAATVHSADGLNDMVYNRCVGTRYCANNCPYKVRRFNFLQYTDYTSDSLKLVNNPEVTVRTRGVMEKCTYCTQRIRNAEMDAEKEHSQRKAAGKWDDARNRPRIMDGEIVTACQAACPTGAITFGDINDDASAVLRAKAEPHGYGLLAEQNTSPRTTYLAAIRNPNPAMPKGV